MNIVNLFLGATFDVLRLAAESIAKSEPLDDGECGVVIDTASIAAYDGRWPGRVDPVTIGVLVCIVKPLRSAWSRRT